MRQRSRRAGKAARGWGRQTDQMLVVRVALAGRRSTETSTLDKFAFIRSQSIGTVSEVTRLRKDCRGDGKRPADGSTEARTEEPGILTAFNERRICLSYN